MHGYKWPINSTRTRSGFEECAGLTMRGSAFLVVDTVQNSHATRRELIDELNFPPTLAFARGATTVANPTLSAIEGQLPAAVRLMTLNCNYKGEFRPSVCVSSGQNQAVKCF